MLAGAVTLSSVCSCADMNSRTYLGTMAGAEIGGTIGEAIGWLSTSRHHGPGTALLGSVIGTVAGAAIGNAASKASAPKKDRSVKKRNTYDSGDTYEQPDFQTGGGYSDDVYTGATPTTSAGQNIVISNVSYQDEDGDGRFARYETINVVYEVTNYGSAPASVELSIDNPAYSKDIAFSPVQTATIEPGKTIRYKAKAFLKNSIKGNHVTINVFAKSAGSETASGSLQVKLK